MTHDNAGLAQFLRRDGATAVTMALGVLVALVWSAASWSGYHHAMDATWWHLSVASVVTNGLLTVFFFAVGLELSREARVGVLRQQSHWTAPVPAALGGMLGTVAVSLTLAAWWHLPALRHGWGVSMSTDVAFVVAVVALAGPRTPVALRLFLLTLAIVDDIASLLVLGVTGTTRVHVLGLGLALVVLALLRWRRGVWWMPLAALVPLWAALAYAGTEPALAGIIVGLTIPATTRAAVWEQRAMLASTGLALPLFALVACGLNWHDVTSGTSPRLVGAIVVTRLVGKVAGITLAVVVARQCGVRIADDLQTRHIVAAGALCTMGFTVPLLFASADFGTASATYGAVTVGLLVATLVGAVSGVALLRRR